MNIVVNCCQFCDEEVFNDDRSVGSVLQKDRSLKHYHLNCLYDKYPNEKDYQSLVLKIFGENKK